MASKAIPRAVLVFRIFTLAACVASGLLLVLDNFTTANGNQTLRFQDVVTFRYVLSAAAIGAAYSILQLPFNIYYAATQKRLICMPEFDFYADKVVSSILFTAVGAGFGAGFELKKMIKILIPLLASLGVFDNLQEVQNTNDDFYEKAIIATGILLVGAVCMAVVSVLTSITRTSNPGFFLSMLNSCFESSQLHSVKIRGGMGLVNVFGMVLGFFQTD